MCAVHETRNLSEPILVNIHKCLLKVFEIQTAAQHLHTFPNFEQIRGQDSGLDVPKHFCQFFFCVRRLWAALSLARAQIILFQSIQLITNQFLPLNLKLRQYAEYYYPICIGPTHKPITLEEQNFYYKPYDPDKPLINELRHKSPIKFFHTKPARLKLIQIYIHSSSLRIFFIRRALGLAMALLHGAFGDHGSEFILDLMEMRRVDMDPVARPLFYNIIFYSNEF